jgi:TPP-dependent pyruvate/acetoin dehydrogenase alpha subunit
MFEFKDDPEKVRNLISYKLQKSNDTIIRLRMKLNENGISEESRLQKDDGWALPS